MIKTSLTRLFHMVLIMIAVSFCAYMLIGLMPGDPIDILVMGNPYATAEDVARLKAAYGLDKSLIERYWAWASNILQGNFGYSRLYATPVLDVLIPALKQSLILIGLSMLFSSILALILGTIAAVKRNSFLDRMINMFAFSGISIPSFWMAIVSIFIFAVWLGVLPAGGMPPEEASLMGNEYDAVSYYILPVLILTLGTIGHYTRYVRSALIEVLSEHYIKTARAKGLKLHSIIIKHALPNAAIPFITVLALDLGGLLSGALITETVFSINGMGKMIYDSIMANDYNLAMAGLLIATLAVLIGNLLADIAQTLLDPRLRSGASSNLSLEGA